MGRLKTRGPDTGQIYISGELKVLQQLSEFEYGVEIKVLRDGVNRKKWDFRNLEEHYLTFLGTPILCAYVGQQIGDGHNMRETIDPETGEKYYTFMDATAERIVGAISDNPEDITLVNEGGHTWIVAKGKLWVFYAPELVKKIVRTGRMDISSETIAVKSHMDGDVEVITVWKALGVTILGDHVAPAIPGANIKALAALMDEFNTLKLKAASLQQQEPQNPAKQDQNTPSTHKGVNSIVKKAKKKQLAELQPKFQNHRILAATEDLKHVVLMSQDGNFVTYTFRDEDQGQVVPSMFKTINLSADIKFSEDTIITLSLDEITDEMGAQIATLSSSLAAAEAAKKAAEDTIAAMKAAEHNRRVKAVEAAVDAENQRLNDLYGSDVTCDFAEKVKKEVEKFASLEDNGNFVGDVEACKELLALCMSKKTEIDEAAKNQKTKTFVWEEIKNNSKPADGLMSAVARINAS